MTRKRLFQIVIVLIAAVWIGSAILAFGVLRTRKNKPQPATLPPLTTTAPSTTAPTTTAAPAFTIDGNQYSTTSSSGITDSSVTGGGFTAAPTTAPTTAGQTVPSTKGAVVAAYLNAVNTLKSTPDFSLVKNETLNVIVDDISPSSVRSMATKIIESNRKTSPVTYRFSGGTDAASGLSPNNVIAPIGRQATLNEAGVQSATATPTAGGGYSMHLVFGTDVQTMTTPAQTYSGVFQTIDKDSMGLPSAAKVDSFTVNYGGASIDATVDSSGRLVNLTHHVTVSSSEGHGSLVMAVTTKMHGDHTATYDISY